MNNGSSALQCGHVTLFVNDGGIDRSPSQARHLKCMSAVMKTFVVALLFSICAQAQTVADIARRERDRQSRLQSSRVITSERSSQIEPPPAAATAQQPNAEETKQAPADPSKAEPSKAESSKAEPSKDAPKAPASPAVDPVQVWNSRLDQLRTKIRGLQDQELALLLQQNQVTNQVHAPVTDPELQQRGLAQLGQIQQQLASVRKDIDEAKRMLDQMQLQGPPKK
jgi:hypothetical protein